MELACMNGNKYNGEFLLEKLMGYVWVDGRIILKWFSEKCVLKL
jgi:hypothetical protein